MKERYTSECNSKMQLFVASIMVHCSMNIISCRGTVVVAEISNSAELCHECLIVLHAWLEICTLYVADIIEQGNAV